MSKPITLTITTDGNIKTNYTDNKEAKKMSKPITTIEHTEERKNLYNTAEGRAKVLKRFSMFDSVGQDLTDCDTLDEALATAGLNYTGIKTPIYLPDGTPIENFWAVTKDSDPQAVLGVVGNQYHPIGNAEAFDVAGAIVDSGYARYEVGGAALKAKNIEDGAKSFLVLRGDDFDIAGDVFNSFVLFRNSFDGSSGVQYQIICQRLVCLNGMVRYLGKKAAQFSIKIQHSKSAPQRIRETREVMENYLQQIEEMKREAQLFINTPMSRAEFEREILPQVLKERKLVENDKERSKGFERVERTISQIISAYDADDVQNFNGTAYKVLLALSDWETHSEPLRDCGNNQVYLNRIAKGMVTTSFIAKYIAETRNLGVVLR